MISLLSYNQLGLEEWMVSATFHIYLQQTKQALGTHSYDLEHEA